MCFVRKSINTGSPGTSDPRNFVRHMFYKPDRHFTSASQKVQSSLHWLWLYTLIILVNHKFNFPYLLNICISNITIAYSVFDVFYFYGVLQMARSLCCWCCTYCLSPLDQVHSTLGYFTLLFDFLLMDAAFGFVHSWSYFIPHLLLVYCCSGIHGRHLYSFDDERPLHSVPSCYRPAYPVFLGMR